MKYYFQYLLSVLSSAISSLASSIISSPKYLSIAGGSLLVAVMGIYFFSGDNENDASDNSKYRTVKLDDIEKRNSGKLKKTGKIKSVSTYKKPVKKNWITGKSSGKKSSWKAKKSNWKPKTAWKKKKTAWSPKMASKKFGSSKKAKFGIATMEMFQEVKRAKKVKKRPSFYSDKLQNQFDTAK